MQDNQLLSQSVVRTLLSMTAPAAIGMVMTFLFQLVDTYFIGLLGTAELAAISFVYPVYVLVVGLFIGIAAGVSSTVGKSLGAGDQTKSQQLVLVALLSFTILTLAISVIGALAHDDIFASLGAQPHNVALIYQYMLPILSGMFLLVIGLIANAALMAKGVMKQTTAVMAFGGLINAIMDYVLIFGMGPIPEMGLKGAAIATVISWLVICLLMLFLLFRHQLLSFRCRLLTAKPLVLLKEILVVASAAVVAQILAPLAVALLTRLVSKYGDNAVAAFGIAIRIESLLLTGILAMSVVITPITAQYFGAKLNSKLSQLIAFAGRLTIYWGGLCALVALLFAPQMISLFTNNAQVIELSSTYFYYLSLTYPAFGLVLLTSSFFNGVQQLKRSLQVSITRNLVLLVPLCLVGSIIGLHGIWLGVIASNLLAVYFAKRLIGQWLAENSMTLLRGQIWQDYKQDWLKLRNLIKG